jgi:ABC-type phosphate transport system permease subunit
MIKSIINILYNIGVIIMIFLGILIGSALAIFSAIYFPDRFTAFVNFVASFLNKDNYTDLK